MSELRITKTTTGGAIQKNSSVTIVEEKEQIKTDLAIEDRDVVPLSAVDKDIKQADNIGYLRFPHDIEIISGGSEMFTPPTGSGASFDITIDGVSALSTLITIDDGEKSSQDAAIPPVFSTTLVLAGKTIGFDTKTIGSTNAGHGAQTWIIYKKV